MCLYNIQNTNIICLYDLTHLKDLWLILTLIIFIRWNLEWINLLVCHETSAYTTSFPTRFVPVPSGTIALQGSRASRGEATFIDVSSWLAEIFKNCSHLFSTLNETPLPERQVHFPSPDWWHHLKMRQESDLGSSPVPSSEKNPVPWWSGKSIPTKTKGSLPFKIVRLIHVTESHLQQFLGRPVSKADASHR